MRGLDFGYMGPEGLRQGIPKRIKNNIPYITLNIRNIILYFSGFLKQLVELKGGCLASDLARCRDGA